MELRQILIDVSNRQSEISVRFNHGEWMCEKVQTPSMDPELLKYLQAPRRVQSYTKYMDTGWRRIPVHESEVRVGPNVQNRFGGAGLPVRKVRDGIVG
jgi:hypothetical protein